MSEFRKNYFEAMQMLSEQKGGIEKEYIISSGNDHIDEMIFNARNLYELWLKVNNYYFEKFGNDYLYFEETKINNDFDEDHDLFNLITDNNVKTKIMADMYDWTHPGPYSSWRDYISYHQI
jgi:hypothetical protein